MKDIFLPQMHDYIDLICYYFNVGEGLQDSQPKIFREAVKSKDSQIWLFMVNNEMNSLLKNHTWDIVIIPNKQSVIGCK